MSPTFLEDAAAGTFKPTQALHLQQNVIKSCSLCWHDENQRQLFLLLEENDAGVLSATN